MNGKIIYSLLGLFIATAVCAFGQIPLLSDEYAHPLRNTILVMGIDHEEANLSTRIATVAPNVTFLAEINGRGIFGQREAEFEFPDLGLQFVAARIVPIDGYITGIMRTSGLNSFTTSVIGGTSHNQSVLVSGGYRWKWSSADQDSELSGFLVDQSGFILNSVMVPMDKTQIEVCWMGDLHQTPEIQGGLYCQIAENVYIGVSGTFKENDITRCFHLGMIIDN